MPGHKGCMVRVIDAIKKEQDIKTSKQTVQNNEEQQDQKENTKLENSSISSNETKVIESTQNKDEVRDIKVNTSTEESNESQSSETVSEQVSGSDSKQGKNNNEEAKS